MSSCFLTWNAGKVSHDLHDEQGEELVLLQHLLRGQRVTVVVESEHDEAPVGADKQQAPDAEHVQPDGPEPGSNCTDSNTVCRGSLLRFYIETFLCILYLTINIA